MSSRPLTLSAKSNTGKLEPIEESSVHAAGGPAFELAGISNTVGALSLALFAKSLP
jgi:hypothetical protein